MPDKPVKRVQARCPQVHRRDTSRVPRACGPCGQRAPRSSDDLTFKTVALSAPKSPSPRLSRNGAGEGQQGAGLPLSGGRRLPDRLRNVESREHRLETCAALEKLLLMNRRVGAPPPSETVYF